MQKHKDSELFRTWEDIIKLMPRLGMSLNSN
jgi:hypothetical protein